MPITHMVAMTPIAKGIGSNRIVKCVAIPHPMCNPDKSPKDQYRQRYELVGRAISSLETDIKEATIFE